MLIFPCPNKGLFSTIQVGKCIRVCTIQGRVRVCEMPFDGFVRDLVTWTAVRRGCPNVSPTVSLALQPWGHTLQSLSTRKTSLFKQPKQPQHGMNARPCTMYHFPQHKLLINYRAFQGHRGIILQNELSAIRNKKIKTNELKVS